MNSKPFLRFLSFLKRIIKNNTSGVLKIDSEDKMIELVFYNNRFVVFKSSEKTVEDCIREGERMGEKAKKENRMNYYLENCCDSIKNVEIDDGLREIIELFRKKNKGIQINFFEYDNELLNSCFGDSGFDEAEVSYIIDYMIFKSFIDEKFDEFDYSKKPYIHPENVEFAKKFFHESLHSPMEMMNGKNSHENIILEYPFDEIHYCNFVKLLELLGFMRHK